MNRLVEPLDALIERLHSDWRPLVEAWRHSREGRALIEHVDRRVAEGVCVYPADVFRALELTPLAQTRVVIVGQDPYHGDGQAEGLAFSVPPGQPVPPSLRNVMKELSRDLGLPTARSGHLGAWARRGVLLLNTCLTVEAGRPASHARRGWEALTDAVIAGAARDAAPKVFMLWGGLAQAKAGLIDGACPPHRVLRCNHPSPLAATRPPVPFMGSGHFGEAQRFLRACRGGEPVFDWSLDDSPGAPTREPSAI